MSLRSNSLGSLLQSTAPGVAWRLSGRTLLAGAFLGLLAVAPVSAAERIWTGAGLDNLWSNVANWQNGRPENGDGVLFPAVSLQPLNVNDLSQLTLATLRIEASALKLSGEELSVLKLITYTAPIGGLIAELALPLNLAGPSTLIDCAPGGTFRVTGPLSAPASATVTLTGGGDFRFTGPVTGTYLAETHLERGFFPGSGFSGPLIRNEVVVGGTTNFATFALQTANQFANSPAVTVLTNGHLINVATLTHAGALRVEGGLVTLNGASPNGLITVNGDLRLGSGSGLRTSAFSSGVPGALSVTGRVSIAGCTFRILPTGAILANPSVVIHNDGADAIEGTFDGLPEGGLLTDNQRVYQISYRGGDGNDVTLKTLGQLAFQRLSPQLPNQIRLEGLSANALPVTLESAVSVGSPIWQLRVTTTPASNGVFQFLDVLAPGEPARFYRARQD